MDILEEKAHQRARRRTRGALRSASAGREKGLAQKYMLAGSAKGR